MPDITPAEIESFGQLCGDLSAALALALSEQINHEAIVDIPEVQEISVSDLMARADTQLCTTFHFSSLLTAESLFLFSEDAACVLADLIEGKQGANTTALTEAQVSLLETGMSGVVRGLATALGNIHGDTLELEGVGTHLAPIALPPVFAMSSSALQVVFPITLPDMLDTRLVLLLIPEMAKALLPNTQEEPVHSEILGEDELAAMLSELTGDAPPAPSSEPASHAGELPVPRGIELILDIPLEVTVELGRVRMLIKDVLELSNGSIVELDRVAGEPVDLLVNGRLVAKGEVVVIEDNFGIRVTEILSPADRVAGLSRGR